MSCKVAANQPIYQALLEKAKSYPEDNMYQKKAYEKVANNLLTFEKNLYSLYDSFDLYVPDAGQSITNFIKEFIKTEVFPPTTSSTLTYSTQAMEEARRLAAQNAPKVEVPEPTCIVPSNQPIYEALLEKAKSYPEDQVYQKKAYEKVANNLLTCNRNLHNLYTSDVIVCLELFPVPGAGYSITKFIKEFIETSKPASKPASKPTTSNKAEVAINSVTLPGPPLTTTITYITIETTQSLDDIMKWIRAMNESVTSNPPK